MQISKLTWLLVMLLHSIQQNKPVSVGRGFCSQGQVVLNTVQGAPFLQLHTKVEAPSHQAKYSTEPSQSSRVSLRGTSVPSSTDGVSSLSWVGSLSLLRAHPVSSTQRTHRVAPRGLQVNMVLAPVVLGFLG